MFTREIMSWPWLLMDPSHVLTDQGSSSNHEKNHVLTKDPIVTVAWLNFNHAQSNSKKLPKKIKLPQMNFLLKK